MYTQFFDCRYTNGFAEGCNNKIKTAKDLIVILAFQSEFSNECIIVIKLFCRIIVIII